MFAPTCFGPIDIFYFNVFSCMYRSFLFIAFNTINKYKVIYPNIISLYNIYYYLFRHFYVIIREFLHWCSATLREFLQLNLLKSQFHKIIKTLYTILDFKLSPCFECCMLSSG